MAQSRIMGAVLAAFLLLGGGVKALQVGTPAAPYDDPVSVPIGTIVTITIPVYDNMGWLGQLCQVPDSNPCGACFGNTGSLTIYPSDPMVMTDPTPVPGDPVDFGYGDVMKSFQVVSWQFTASRAGTASFSILVYDQGQYFSPIVEGCGDVGNCGFSGLPYGTNVCGFATVTVTSDLAGRLEARSVDYADRPAGQAYVGDTVEAVMSVTNTGTAPISIRYAVCATIATLSNAVLSPPVSEPSFPVSLPSKGDDEFLTWRFDATPAGVGSQVVFRADAEGTQAYSGTLYITAAPLDISVTIYVDPDGSGAAVPVLAGPFFYFLQDETEVRATVTNTSPYSLTADPSCLPPSMGSGYADFVTASTRIPAPGPVTIGPGGSQVFTWRYALDRGGYFAWCQGDYGDASFAVTARGAAGIARYRILDHPFALSVESPPAVQTGKGFSATLWLTNASDREAVLDPSATPFIDFDVPGLVTAVGGPFPAPPVTLDPGERVAFRFDYTAVSEGTEQFRGGISYGQVSCIYAPNLVVTEVVAPCPLDLVFTPTKTVVGNGEPYMLVLEVHNNSSCPANLDYIVPPGATLWSNWLGDPASGPYPIPGEPVPAGGTAVFTFTVAGRECGQVTWSGTVGGSWGAGCGGAAYSRPYSSSPPVRVRQPAAYSCSAATSVSEAYVGDTLNLFYTLVPVSDTGVTAFSLSMEFNNTYGASITVTGEPQVPTVIEPCPQGCWLSPCEDKAVTFTWTVTVLAQGGMNGVAGFTITASGLDEYSGGPAYSLWDPYACPSYTGPLTIREPSILAVDLNADDPQPGMRCEIPIEVCANAVGDTDVTFGSAVFSVIPLDGKGGGYVTALVGIPPWPPSQFSVGCNYYTATLVPTSAGQVVLGLTVTGTEVLRGTPLQATAFSDPITIMPAELTATSGGPNSYNAANTLSDFSVSMSVSNSGMVPGVILGVTPRPDILPCLNGAWAGLPLAAVVLSATNYEPSPRTVYGCGDRKSFGWTYATGAGSDGAVAFSMTVTGWTQEGGTEYVGTVTPCVRVYNRPPPYVRMVGVEPVNVFRGGDVTLTIEMVNTGETAVTFNRNDTIPRDHIFSMTPGLTVKTKPPVSTVVPAGSSARVTTVLGVGNSMPFGQAQTALVSQGSSSIYTFGGLFPIYTYYPPSKSWVTSWANIDVLASGDPARFSVIPSESSMTISENPYRPLAGPLAITYRLPEGGKVAVKVYTITGELARNVFEGEQAPGEYTLSWDGRNGSRQVIASGIYFLRFESRGLKTTKKLAVLK